MSVAIRLYPRAMPAFLVSAVLTVVLVMHASPAAARPNRRDIAATHTYLAQYYHFLQTTRTNLATRGRTAEDTLVSRVKGNCAGALMAAPPSQNLTILSQEVFGSLSLVAFSPSARAGLAFSDRARSLHWTRPSVTRAVHEYATQVKAYSTLRIPDLCANVLAYHTTDFTSLPSSTQTFVRRFIQLEDHPDEVSPRLLAIYERPADASLLARIKRLEAQIESTEQAAVASWHQILRLLGIARE